jgi:hypothetical protein
MRTVPRPRHYVSPRRLAICRPLLAFDEWRGAYVLRGLGHRLGPVLREDRRSGHGILYEGPDRRAGDRTAMSRGSGHRILSR